MDAVIFWTEQSRQVNYSVCIPNVALLVSKPSRGLQLFFSPSNLVMLVILHRTNTGHRAVSLNNESNAQNKFTFTCGSCHAFNVVHQPSSFCALCFAIFASWTCDICLANIFLKLLTNTFCLLPSFFTSTVSVPHAHLVATFFTWNISKHLRHFVLWKVYC